jgi:hypothetical protein
MHQDFRRATIDSCTAAEVSLARAIGPKLLGLPSLDDSLPQGVVELFRTWVCLGGNPPVSEAHVKHQLAGPRNRAAHGGDPLNIDVADQALGTARKLVNVADPLPGPGIAAAVARRRSLAV